MTTRRKAAFAFAASLALAGFGFVTLKNDAHFTPLALPPVAVWSFEQSVFGRPNHAGALVFAGTVVLWFLVSFGLWRTLDYLKLAERAAAAARWAALGRAALAFGTTVAVVIIVLWPILFTAERRYHRVVWTMRQQIIDAMPRTESRETERREENARIEVIRALQTAIANAQCEYRNVDRDKVRAIAAGLRRTDGELLRTRQGTYQLWRQLESACPDLHEYIWISQLREMQQGGTIPRFDEAPAAPKN